MKPELPDISIRLKKFRERTELSMAEIADATGILESKLYKWETGESNSDAFLGYEILTKFMNEWERNQEGQNAVREPIETTTQPIKKTVTPQVATPLPKRFVLIALEGFRLPLPWEDENAEVGKVILINNLRHLIAYANDSWQFRNAHGLIEVDESLTPDFKQGANLAIRRIKFPDDGYFPDRNYLVIDNKNRMYFRRIDIGSGRKITLLSDRFPAVELHLDKDGVAVFKVVGLWSEY